LIDEKFKQSFGIFPHQEEEKNNQMINHSILLTNLENETAKISNFYNDMLTKDVQQAKDKIKDLEKDLTK